jgi:glycosyltransferase involved in cell wall biosynthesis
MKVLIVSQYFWPENFRINELAQELQKNGVKIDILTGKPNYPSGSIYEGYDVLGCTSDIWQDITIYRVPLLPRGSGALRLMFNYLSFILSGLIIGPWLLRGKPYDAIFVFGTSPIFQAIPAVFFGYLKNCPAILWVQDLWPESLAVNGYITHKVPLKAIEYFVKLLYRRMDLILVQSKAFIPKVSKLAGVTSVFYYPNFFPNIPYKKNYESSIFYKGFDSAFPLLFAGNIGLAQAVDVIIEAANILKEVKDIHFVIMGDGSRREWMIQESFKRDLYNISFPGQCPIEMMPFLMGKASALLVTLADVEVFSLTIPSKIQAYLAAGRPIIGCLNGVGGDIINEAKAGIVVPAQDALALANAIYTLSKLSNEEKLDMGTNGRRYYEENFTPRKLVKELIDHIDQTINLYQKKKL